MPAAPVRFSITIGWPSASPSAGATVRAVMSTLPPGTKGTMRRIGFAGKPCAEAAQWTNARRASAAKRSMLFRLGLLLLVGLLLRRGFLRLGLLGFRRARHGQRRLLGAFAGRTARAARGDSVAAALLVDMAHGALRGNAE